MPTPAKPQTPRNRRRCLAFIIIGITIQTLIIIAFVVTFIRVRNPKVRLRSVTVENMTVNSKGSPSLSVTLNAQVTVKNSNFGHFKFPDSAVSVLYRGNVVGRAVIPGARVRARSTKKLKFTIAARAEEGRSLGSDLNSEKVRLSGQATLHGKIRLFKVFRKKKTGTMNCAMDVNTRRRTVDNLLCS